jgi:ankyrin repeat protein
VEFCRDVSFEALDIEEDYFMELMGKYDTFLQVLKCCKRGDVTLLRSLLQKGPTINSLSPDQNDGALSACIRYNQWNCLDILLNHPMIRVNVELCPFHGQHQRSTSLHVAARAGLFRMCWSLLKHGAKISCLDSSIASK